MCTLATPHCHRCGCDQVDLAALGSAGLLSDVEGLDPKCFAAPTLNEFMAYDRPVWQATRARLQKLLTTDESFAEVVGEELATPSQLCLDTYSVELCNM